MLLGKDINKLLTLKGNIISSSACEINKKIFSLIQENISPLINIDDIHSLVRLKGKEYQYILLCNDKLYILSKNKMAYTIYYDSINRITRDNNIYNNKSINEFYYSIYESHTRPRETIGLKITYTINHKKQNFYIVGKVNLINYIRNYITGQLNSKYRHYKSRYIIDYKQIIITLNKMAIEKNEVDILFSLIKKSDELIWNAFNSEEILQKYHGDIPNIVSSNILRIYLNGLFKIRNKNEALAELLLQILKIINDYRLFEIVVSYLCTLVSDRNKKELKKFIDRFILGKLVISNSELKKLYLKFQNDISGSNYRRNIIVIANMSSGKSTLINAIIGRRVAASSIEACTNTIIQYQNKLCNDESVINTLQNSFKGDEKECKEKIYDKSVINVEFRSIYNNKSINIIDTPGINNSLNLKHRYITLDFLKNESYEKIIYVLNCGKLGTNEEMEYLTWLANNIDKSKVIFVLNKVDILTKEDNLTESIRKLQFDLNELGFQSGKIYPIMAYPALLFKLEKYNEYLNDDEIDELELYKRRIHRDYYDLSRYIDKIDDINMLYINNTGILELEKIIFS